MCTSWCSCKGRCWPAMCPGCLRTSHVDLHRGRYKVGNAGLCWTCQQCCEPARLYPVSLDRAWQRKSEDLACARSSYFGACVSMDALRMQFTSQRAAMACSTVKLRPTALPWPLSNLTSWFRGRTQAVKPQDEKHKRCASDSCMRVHRRALYLSNLRGWLARGVRDTSQAFLVRSGARLFLLTDTYLSSC